MINIRYVRGEDKDFRYSLDKHFPETEFEIKVRGKRGCVLLLDDAPETHETALKFVTKLFHRQQ